MKEVWVEFSEDANESYLELQKKALEDKEQGKENSSNIQLLKAINREVNNIKLNPQHGVHIPRRNIPKALAEKYGTKRLWKVNLVGFWRLLYTLTGDEIKIIALILEFMDHNKYNKAFGYKKK